MAEIIIREQGGKDAKRTEVFQDSFDIMGDDGRVLYTIRLYQTGALGVSAEGGMSKHSGQYLSSQLAVRPYSTNCIHITRIAHESGGERY